MKKELIEHLERETGLSRAQLHGVLATLAKLTSEEPEEELQDATSIDEAKRFWQCVSDAIAAGRLVREEDYRSDGVRVGLIWKQVYAAYEVHYRHRWGRDGMGSAALLSLLRKKDYYVTVAESMRVGDRKTSVMLFDQPNLPVPLPASVVRNKD